MMMFLRPTVLLRVAKRTAASNAAVRNRGKRAAVVATPFSAATTARGIQIHENRNTPLNSESRNNTTTTTTTTIAAAAMKAAAAKSGKTVSAGQRKLQRSSSSNNSNNNNSTQQKVSTKQSHNNTNPSSSNNNSNKHNNGNSNTNSNSNSSSNKNVIPTKTTTPSSTITVVSNNSSFVPDYREKVLQIFQRLAEINNALQERYKAQSYQIAVDNLKRDDYIFLHIPPNIIAPGVDDVRRKKLIEAVHNTPKVGEKLKTKMIEILTTGDLAELHSLQAKPIIRAIQELTQVHGFGPRTAVGLYKKYGVKSVAELQQRIKDQESGNHTNNNNNIDKKTYKKSSSSSKNGNDNDSILHLTEAQRLGLKYHRDISQRIPHEEVRLHEAFLKLRLRKYLGKGYDLSICGSYRRRLPTSGDIDVLITRKTSNHIDAVNRKKNLKGNNNSNNNNDNNSRGERVLAPQEVLAAFVEALKQERYIEATLAQGSTKFMGVSRLKSYNYNAGATQPKLYPARRLDIRFVEPECFPAALLYFTGSKNFNVVMRAEAIKRRYILNEYGLFRTDAVNTTTGNHDDNEDDEDNNNKKGGNSTSKKSTGRARWNAETFQKVLRAQYYSAKTPGFGNDDHHNNDNDNEDEDSDDNVGEKHSKKKPNGQQQQNELAALWREVEARRVKVKHERDVFAALGMTYVQPEHREV